MYATPADVRSVLARDTTTESGMTGTAAELSDTDITAAINSAQAQVDGRLGNRYTTPFVDPVPQLIADITRDIAAYLCDLTYRQGKDYESQMDPVVLRYQQAQTLLAQIAAGQVDLPVGPSVVEPGTMRGIQPYTGTMFSMGEFGLGVDSRGRRHVR